MTSSAQVTSCPRHQATAAREAAIAANPCPFQAAILKHFPNIEIRPEGASVAMFVAALRNVNVSRGACLVLERALRGAAVANGKSGEYFDAADIRKTAFLDGLSTFIFRNGFNQQRFDELMKASPNDSFGAADVARLVRACRSEQSDTANAKAVFFTLFEHSAIRHFLAGGDRIKKGDLEAFFAQGVLTDHLLDPAKPKTLPRAFLHTAAAGLAYGAQVAINAITGGANADLPKLTPVPPTLAAGAAAATEPAKGKCPFGHG